MEEHSVYYYIIRILLLAVFTAPIYLLARNLLNGKLKLWPAAFLFGGIFTLITLIFLQGHSVFFSQEGTVLAKLSWLKEKLSSGKPSYQMVNQRFIFVNTALNPVLTDLKDTPTQDDDSAKQVITNRLMLQRTLNFLADQPTVQLVVCDLIFADSTKDQSDLLTAFQRLEKENKLLMAYNKDWSTRYPYFFKHLDISSFGDVTNVKDEPFYFSHKVMTEEQVPSLPYQMYLKLKHVKAYDGYLIHEGNHWVPRNFIPEFCFTNEKALFRIPLSDEDTAAVKTEIENNLRPAEISNYFTLSSLSGIQGQEDFCYLTGNTSEKNKIIYIGNFTDNYIDVHPTAFGNMHGATILLNEFFYIWNGYHAFTIWRFAAYCLTLWVLFSIMFAYLFQEKVFLIAKERRRQIRGRFSGFWKRWLISVWEFIREEGHYILLFIITLIIDVVFHKLLNVMGLLYLLVPLSALLRQFADQPDITEQGSTLPTDNIQHVSA